MASELQTKLNHLRVEAMNDVVLDTHDALVSWGVLRFLLKYAPLEVEEPHPSLKRLQYRDVRPCPECGAAIGTACRRPTCPQLKEVGDKPLRLERTRGGDGLN